MMVKVGNILFIIFFCLISGCQPKAKIDDHKERAMTIDKIYNISLGLEGDKNLSEYSKDSLDQQPAGMSFRDLNFTPPNLGKVSLDVAGQSLMIDHVFNVMGSSKDYDPNLKGIQSLDINAGLNKEEFVSQEKAYQAYVNLVNQINNNGWKNYFLLSMPRIGVDKDNNVNYLFSNGVIIEPKYILTYEEWNNFFSKKSSLDYNLYLNGVYIVMSINKGGHKDNQVQYMLKFDITTMRSYMRNLVTNSYKMTSVEFEKAYTSELIIQNNYRLESEKDMIKQGYKIDENYKDPDVWEYVK